MLKTIPVSDKKFEKLLVPEDIMIHEALKRMDEGAEKILMVVDGSGKLQGTITDGDIRRWILREGNMNATVAGLYQRSPKTAPEHFDIVQVKAVMIREKIEVIPVVDSEGRLVNVLLWDEIFSDRKTPGRSSLNVPVVVMAGGQGGRMDPLTKILPKPLIPLGEKPIVELIMDRFAEFGCSEFYLTVHYKGKMIQSYFENTDCRYRVKLLWEDRPGGTAGGLRLASEWVNTESFFVTNCDVMVKTDYADLLEFHRQRGADLTIVSSIRHFTVPYGVLETDEEGFLTKIAEKPEYDFWVNTGLYVLRKEVIRHIPKTGAFDFPDLIRQLSMSGGKISVYPVSQSSWVDMGQLHEYQKALQNIQS